MTAQPSVTAAAMPTVRRMMSKFDGRRQLGIGLEREFLDHHAGEFVDGIEALQQQGGERAKIDHAQPQQRRGKQQRQQHIGLAPEQAVSRSPQPRSGSVTGRASPRVLHHVQGVLRRKPRPTVAPVSGTGWPAGTSTASSVPRAVDDDPGSSAQIAQGADRARQRRIRRRTSGAAPRGAGWTSAAGRPGAASVSGGSTLDEPTKSATKRVRGGRRPRSGVPTCAILPS